MSLLDMNEKESERRVSPVPSVRSDGSDENTSNHIAPIAAASYRRRKREDDQLTRKIEQCIARDVNHLCAFSVFDCFWRMGESRLSALINPYR